MDQSDDGKHFAETGGAGEEETPHSSIGKTSIDEGHYLHRQFQDRCSNRAIHLPFVVDIAHLTSILLRVARS